MKAVWQVVNFSDMAKSWGGAPLGRAGPPRPAFVESTNPSRPTGRRPRDRGPAPQKKGLALVFTLAVPLLGAQIPAGTELSIRLSDKVASEAQTQPAVIHAVLIASVILNGAVAVSAGAQLTGSVKQAKAATDKDAAQLQLVFTELRDGTQHANISAVVTSLDNARETVDDKGLITGVAPDATLSARIDQG